MAAGGDRPARAELSLHQGLQENGRTPLLWHEVHEASSQGGQRGSAVLLGGSLTPTTCEQPCTGLQTPGAPVSRVNMPVWDLISASWLAAGNCLCSPPMLGELISFVIGCSSPPRPYCKGIAGWKGSTSFIGCDDTASRSCEHLRQLDESPREMHVSTV